MSTKINSEFEKAEKMQKLQDEFIHFDTLVDEYRTKAVQAIEAYIKAYFDNKPNAHVDYGYSLSLTADGHVVDDDSDDAFEEVEFEDLCCSYDGGNHPEYASNCFSAVLGVGVKDGHFYLNLEDDDEYELYRSGYEAWTCAYDAISNLVEAGVVYEED